jgi:hypothetical protein
LIFTRRSPLSSFSRPTHPTTALQSDKKDEVAAVMEKAKDKKGDKKDDKEVELSEEDKLLKESLELAVTRIIEPNAEAGVQGLPSFLPACLPYTPFSFLLYIPSFLLHRLLFLPLVVSFLPSFRISLFCLPSFLDFSSLIFLPSCLISLLSFL